MAFAPVGTSAKSSINLFSRDFEAPKILHSVVRGSYVFVGVYLLLLSALGGGVFFLARQASTLESANSALSDQVAGLKTQEGLLQTLKNRVSLSRDVFSQSAAVQTELVNNLIADLPGGIILSSIQTNEKGVIILSGKSPNSGLLNDWFSGLKAKNYSQVTLDSLSNSEDGGYSFTVGIVK